MPARRVLLLWFMATAAAETVGYACAAALSTMPAGPILAGVVEGTLLGGVQGYVLMRVARGFPGFAWWALTAAVATAGWGLSSGLQSMGGTSTEPPLGLVLAGAFAFGIVIGAVSGAAQWMLLRRRFERAWTWIPSCAVGWGVGMVPALWVATVPQTAPGLAELLFLGAVGGLLMGAAVGAVTGFTLSRLVPRTFGRLAAG